MTAPDPALTMRERLRLQDDLNARMDASRARFDALVAKAHAEGREVFSVGVPSMPAPYGRMTPRW